MAEPCCCAIRRARMSIEVRAKMRRSHGKWSIDLDMPRWVWREFQAEALARRGLHIASAGLTAGTSEDGLCGLTIQPRPTPAESSRYLPRRYRFRSYWRRLWDALMGRATWW